MDTVASTTSPSPHTAEPTDGPLTFDELKMAYRCPGMPLDALRFEVTPVGLHYQVVHFDIPHVDRAAADGWTLEIGGLVERPTRLTLEDVMRRPAVTVPVTLECAGNGRALMSPRPVSGPWLTGGLGTATWTGTPLRDVIEEAAPSSDAVDLVFTGIDHGIQGDVEQDYARSLPLEEALAPDVLLAYGMNGRELEPQHGFPLRLIVPAWYGMASVKWLTRIDVIGHTFSGFQNAVAYRYQADAGDSGEPVTRKRVKSLMAPPGIPEFVTERRIVDAGPVRLAGRAWSGAGDIVAVDVGVDGNWHPAQLDDPLGTYAWRGWSFTWDAQAGEHELMCRATDSAGNRQPLETPWNHQGMGNNAVQRTRVTVRDLGEKSG